MDNLNMANNQNVVNIIDHEKKVDEMNWAQFAAKMETNGWTNAQNDSTLRALFNIADNTNALKENITLLKDKQFNQQNKDHEIEAQRTTIRNSIRDQIIVPTKDGNKPEFYKEEMKSSVLFIQSELNSKQQENYNFEQYLQQLQQAQNRENNNNNNINNNINNNNNNNNRNIENNRINENNNENNLNNAINEEPENEQHNPAPRISLAQIKGDVTDLKEHIRNSQTTFFRFIPGFRNSKEFREARDAFNKFSKKWERLNKVNNINDINDNKEKPLSGVEIVYLQIHAEETRDKIKRYLDAKLKECGGVDNLMNLSPRTRSRYIAMQDALEKLNQHLQELDRREEEIDNEPVKSAEELYTEATDVYTEMENQYSVFWKSSEYKDAIATYKKAFDVLKEIQENGEEKISIGQIDEARRHAQVAAEKIWDYLQLHINDDNMGKNRTNRMSAMSDGYDSAKRIKKKFDQMYKKVLETPSKKSFSELRNSVQEAYQGILDENWDTKKLSRKYRAARKAYEEFKEVFDAYSDKNDFKSLSAGEIKSITRKMDVAEKALDNYLEMKAGERKESKTATARIQAMRNAKSALLETKRTINALNKEREQASDKLSDNDVKKSVKEDYRKVTMSQNQATFGSLKYRWARISYSKVYEEVELLRLGKRQLSEKELKNLQKDVETAKKDIARYIAAKSKELKKKGDLSPKGHNRLQAMKEAYNSMDKLSHKIDRKLKKGTVNFDNDIKELKKQIHALKISSRQKEGPARYIEKCASDGLTFISHQGEKTVLSDEAKKFARMALAAILLNTEKDKFGPEKMKCADTFDDCIRSIEAIGKSEQFKKEFPDSKLTPEYLIKLVGDKKELERLRNKYSTVLRTGDPQGKLNYSSEKPEKKESNPELKPGSGPVLNK